jgi:hypothetical protein
LAVTPGVTPGEAVNQERQRLSNPNTDSVAVQPAKLGKFNEALFTASCGPSCFTTATAVIQRFADQPLIWEWHVTPPDEKDIVLSVSLWAKVSEDGVTGDYRTMAKTFDASIKVRVSPYGRARRFFVANWQWLWGAVPAIAGGFAWLWSKRRRRERPIGFGTND